MKDNMDAQEKENILFGHNSPWLKISLIVIFVLAALIRRDEIRAPGHLIEREYNSAIFARYFYFNNNHKVEQWQKDIARITKEQLPTLEPPVTEYLVAWIYRIMGREEIWYSRYLTSLLWIISGYFLYKITSTLISPVAGIFATSYYLFVPLGITISRSFQPDSLMMMMFLVSLYCVLLYNAQPSWKRLILTGSMTGLTLFFRPLVLFALFGAFIATTIQRMGSWKGLFNKHFLVYCFVSFLPPFAFYGYGIFIAGFLGGQASLSFRPHLLTKWEFWYGWFEVGISVTGYAATIAAILGFWSVQYKNRTKALLIGLIGGYFIFGLFFTFHIHSHPYYHIQLFPVIGICIASLFATFEGTIKNLSLKNWLFPVVVCCVLVLYVSYKEVKGSYYTRFFEDPVTAKEVGDIIGHSSRTVFVAYHYGLPLEYYGQLAGAPWPVRIDDPFYRPPNEKERSVQERLETLGFIPEYFVITNFDLYNRKHPDLRIYLENNCSIRAQTDQYLIYGSCQTPAFEESQEY